MPKVGDSTNDSNYRSISVISILRKIFQKVVHKQLYTYLEQINVFNQHQFGFRRHKSTLQALPNHML